MKRTIMQKLSTLRKSTSFIPSLQVVTNRIAISMPKFSKPQKSKLFIALLLSLTLCYKEAYAIFDVPATIQTVLEKVTEAKNKIEEIQKKVEEGIQKAKEGFQAATSCIKNPTACNISQLTAFAMDGVNRITNIAAMPKSIYLESKKLAEEAQDKLIEDTRKNYLYVKGMGQSLSGVQLNRINLNAVINDEIAQLYAKGMTTMFTLSKEQEKDNEIYPTVTAEKEDSVKGPLARIKSRTAQRLARILELRANMPGAQVTAELKEQSQEEEK